MFFAFAVPCFCSVAKSCPTVCDHMDCSTPGFPVLHYLPESAQIQVHWVNDAIQPSISSSDALFSSCPQSFPALWSFPISRLFVLGGQSTGASASASVIPKDIQGWFPLRIDWFDLLAVQRTFKVQKHQFFSAQLSLLSNSHIHKWLLKKL